MTNGHDGSYASMAAFGSPTQLWRRDDQATVTSAPGDFPDYLVYVTRETLLAATTALSTISAEIRDFFCKISQMLAFERMMREFFFWTVPGAQIWPFMAPATFAMPIRQEPQLLSYWGGPFPALPRPQVKPAATESFSMPDLTFVTPVYSAALSISAATLAFAPMFADVWRAYGVAA
jgi:hypothetical protein